MTIPSSTTVGATSSSARRPWPGFTPPLLGLGPGAATVWPDALSATVDMHGLLAGHEWVLARYGAAATPATAPYRRRENQPADAAEMAALMSLIACSGVLSPLIAA